jgi:hypothetical protein
MAVLSVGGSTERGGAAPRKGRRRFDCRNRRRTVGGMIEGPKRPEAQPSRHRLGTEGLPPRY